MSRKPIIAANWKMNVGISEARNFVDAFLPMLGNGPLGCDVVIAPTFTSLPATAEKLAGQEVVAVSAQNCSQFDSGAYTGEISTGMLEELGVKYVVLGHSERRQYFGETDEIINAKIKKVIAAGMTPIFCIGETLEERDGGKLNEVLERQIVKGLEGIDPAVVATVVVAYEPVWAIGTGRTATAEQAQEAHAFCRGVVASTFGQQTADSVRIQYGGSVKPENTAELMAQPDIDGALVGGASLKPDSFAAIVKNAVA